MCDLKMCRICLRTECKLYRSEQIPLKYYYEEVMSYKSNNIDKLPQYFCYECAMLLHKFHKFKEKCCNGQNILLDLIYKNALTYKEVSELNRKRKIQHLHTNLSIMQVSKRVKTYNFTYDEECDYEEEEVEIDFTNKNNVRKEEHKVNIKNQEIDTIDYNNTSNTEHKEERISDNYDIQPTENLPDNDDHFDAEPFFDDFNLNDTKPKDEEMIDKDLDTRIPSPVSSDDEVLALKVENKAIDIKKDGNVELGVKVPKFQREKKGPHKLSAGNWKKMNLSDEEALQRFEAKACDSKYVAATYKCELCYRWFSKADILHRHNVMRHKQSLPLECRFCKMRFRVNFQLQKHMKQHYNVFECQRCYFVCPLEQSAIFHDESHNGKIRKCEVCFKEFTHSSTYYSHMTTHRTNFVCTICGRSFVSEFGLDIHKKRTHVGEQTENSERVESETMYCQRCDIKFEARAAYDEHLFHSANHTDDIVDADNVLQRFQKKVCGVKEKAVLAEEIRNRKDQEPGLMLYKSLKKVGVRTPKKTPMNCYQCGKHFESQMQCRKHHIKEHPRTTFVYPGTPERTICEICGADLAFGSVMAHLNMHSREKLYKCEICERSFVQNATLKRHMLVHTGERPFPCTMCEKRFTQAASKALHIRTVHLKQPHPKRLRIVDSPLCRACEESEETMRHILCLCHSMARKRMDLFGSAYPELEDYRHYTPGDILKFMQSFFRNPGTHTGERPYPCSLCDKRFTQSNSQQLHYRTVHLKEPHPKRNRRKKIIQSAEDD